MVAETGFPLSANFSSILQAFIALNAAKRSTEATIQATKISSAAPIRLAA